MRQRRRRQSGLILICVLACLAIVMGIAASMLKTALAARRAARQELQLSQTEFLLAAGVQLAVQQLTEDEDYSGETWELAGDVLPGNESAVVEIDVVAPNNDQPAQVRVTAQLPADSPESIRRSYTFSLIREE
jgi:type II secretory pathway component PulK